MGTNLSRELRKYYTRKGNRIVFANGMTLNKLAWEMWEKLGFGEMDPSVLSRVLGGSRLLSSKQLKVFCEILKVDEFRRDLLFQSLREDILTRTGIDSGLWLSKDSVVIGLIEENLNEIKAAQARGLPLLVIEWSQALINKIDEFLPRVYTSANRRKLLSLEGKLLVILDQCRIVSNEPDGLLQPISRSSKKLMEIGEYLGDKDLVGTACLNLGNGYYDCEDFEKSLEYFTRASDLMSVPFGNDISEAPPRALALSLVYLARKEEYSVVKKVMVNNLPKYPIDIKCFVTEALGRCEAIFGNKEESKKWFLQSEEYLGEIKDQKLRYGPLREIQLIRSLIEASLHLGGSKTEELSQLGDAGIALAKNNGYMFYAHKISELLGKSV